MEVALVVGGSDWNTLEIKGEFTGWVQVNKETVDLLDDFVSYFSGSDVVGGQDLYLVKKVDLVKNPFTLDQIGEMVAQKTEEIRVRQESKRRDLEAKAAQKEIKAKEKAARKAREQLELLVETVKPEEREALLARLQGTGA